MDICPVNESQKSIVMKTIVFSILASFISFTGGELVRTYKTDQASSSMKVLGTSSLHDWEMQAKNVEGVMNVDLYENNLDIKNLKLTIDVKSLKSDKSSMDQNAYKALNASRYSSITYELSEVKDIRRQGDNKYKMVTTGKLSIAGQTRIVNIAMVGTIQGENLEFQGSTRFNMSQFGVEPPSLMFGKITTGDEITINFNINYKSA